MIASAIRFSLQNLPAVLFVFALVIAAATRRDGPAAGSDCQFGAIGSDGKRAALAARAADLLIL